MSWQSSFNGSCPTYPNPTGGGTGLIGMWKAFDEMESMGWIDSRSREW